MQHCINKLKQIRQYGTTVLLALILFLIMPEGITHALSGHEDTHCSTWKGTTLDNTHTHCIALTLMLSAFISADNQLVLLLILTGFLIPQRTFRSYFIFPEFSQLSLRGPPVTRFFS